MLRRKATVWARWKDPGIKQECYSGILQISLNKNWLANYILTAGRCLFIYILKTAFVFVDKYHPQDRKLRAQWEVSVLFISSFFHHECFQKLAARIRMYMIICSCICVFFFETRKVLFPEHHNEGKQTENKHGACSELSCLSWVLPALSKGAEKCFHRHEHEINV